MMERLIGSFLTTQKHTNMFYKHELAHPSLITAVHRLHCAGFLSILQKTDRKELPGNLFTHDFGYFKALGQFGGSDIGDMWKDMWKKNKVSIEKNKGKQIFSAFRDVE